MNIQPNIILFSAEKSDQRNGTNYASTEWCKKLLSQSDIPFVSMVGSYQFKTENSFLVLMSHIESVKYLCELFKQESYLVSFGDRSSFLVDIESQKETFLGKLVNVSKEDALKSGNWTYNNETGLYYTTIK